MTARWVPPSKLACRFNMQRAIGYVLAGTWLLIACAPSVVKDDAARYTGNTHPTPKAFSICSGHGCDIRHPVRLSKRQWRIVRESFEPFAKDAAQERHRIARAIALLEQTVGEKTGTSADDGGTFETARSTRQMDCLDEAVNTQTYLRLMQEDDLLKFHEVMGRVRRGNIVDRWPHTAALIEETDTHQQFVVDSWFLDNGKPPYILPLTLWQTGWQPNLTKENLGN